MPPSTSFSPATRFSAWILFTRWISLFALEQHPFQSHLQLPLLVVEQFLPKNHPSRDSAWLFHQTESDKEIFDQSHWHRRGHQVMLLQSQCAFWGELGPNNDLWWDTRNKESQFDLKLFPFNNSGPSFNVFNKSIILCQGSAFHWEKYAPTTK